MCSAKLAASLVYRTELKTEKLGEKNQNERFSAAGS